MQDSDIVAGVKSNLRAQIISKLYGTSQKTQLKFPLKDLKSKITTSLIYDFLITYKMN